MHVKYEKITGHVQNAGIVLRFRVDHKQLSKSKLVRHKIFLRKFPCPPILMKAFQLEKLSIIVQLHMTVKNMKQPY